MKFLQVILTLSVLLVVPLLVVESSCSSSTPDNNLVSNITRGSSLSLNDTSTPYWLSPSGTLAFGFHQISWSPDRYVVGIWFVKSPYKTLVWTANRNDRPLHKSSSIHFTDDGKFMLRIMPDNKDKLLLPDVPEPASYAKMHDNGNFVLYGSDSQIIWESFDYPTDTILGGQKLKAGTDLISKNHRLSVRQADGLVAIYDMDVLHEGYRTDMIFKVVSDEIGDSSVSTPLTLNLDSATGNLYLVGSDDVILKYLYRNKKQQQEKGCGCIKEEDAQNHIYRATLDSEGIFILYKERIDGYINTTDHNGNVLVWQNDQVDHVAETFILVILGMVDIIGVLVLGLIGWDYLKKWRSKKSEKAGKSGGGDLESGKTY